MSAFMILFLAGAAAAAAVLGSIMLRNQTIGSPAIAAVLFTLFSLFTVATIAHDGAWTVIENHTVNFWGIQVWYDLLISVGIALFFIAPRARKVGMSIPLWVVFVGLTASIGLLAMVARLFWLERQTA